MILKIKPSQEVEQYYINHKAAFKGDSGIDLFFPEDIVCKANKTTLIDLGISCMMETSDGDSCSYYVYARSSISKTPLMLHNNVGIIDTEYRNTIKVAMYNTSKDDYKISKGERLVQVCAPNLMHLKVQVVDDLPSSDRGAGFGSSGV